MERTPSPTNGYAVLVFSDGTLPEILLGCSQFRLVADLALSGRATPFHRLQLQRHLEDCATCAARASARARCVVGLLPAPRARLNGRR